MKFDNKTWDEVFLLMEDVSIIMIDILLLIAVAIMLFGWIMK